MPIKTTVMHQYTCDKCGESHTDKFTVSYGNDFPLPRSPNFEVEKDGRVWCAACSSEKENVLKSWRNKP